MPEKRDAVWYLKVVTSAMVIVGTMLGVYLYLREGIAAATTRGEVHEIIDQRIEVHELKGHESTERSLKELQKTAREVERAVIRQSAAIEQQTAEIKSLKRDVRRRRER